MFTPLGPKKHIPYARSVNYLDLGSGSRDSESMKVTRMRSASLHSGRTAARSGYQQASLMSFENIILVLYTFLQ
jgi:hypothetical protein